MSQALAKLPHPAPGQPLRLGMGVSLGLHLLLATGLLCWPFAPAGPKDKPELVQTVKLVELPPPAPKPLPPPPPPEIKQPAPPPPPPPPKRQLPLRSPRPVAVASSPPSANARAIAEEAVGPVGEAIGASGPVREPSVARGQASSEAGPAQAVDWNAYHGSVWAKVHRAKTYPAQARRMRWEGKARIEFVIDAQGRVRQARVTDSSGYLVLDQEALTTVRKAAPFPSPPLAAGRDGLTMEIAIVFELN